MRFMGSGVLVGFALGLAAASTGCGGGGGGGGARSCARAEDCGDSSRCLDSVCVANGAPVAAIDLPDAPETLALVELVGSRSYDPDARAGDRIQAFQWSITSLDGACLPPAVAGTDAVARVRFECKGTFRVTLVAVDEMGTPSLPAIADMAVGQGVETLVQVGADQVLHHACSGTPIICSTEGGLFALSAWLATGAQPVGTVVYHWSSDPPQDGALDEHRKVIFSPSAEVATPAVRIEVDDAAIPAIKDDWIFRVRARDDAGSLGESVTRVTVTNRPPVLAEEVAAVPVDHTYSSGSYHASAPVSRWVDPDGDPLAPAGPTGDETCSSYAFRPDGTAVVECARAFTDLTDLAAFVADHPVSILPRDPWEAAAAPKTTTITIHNRPVSAASSAVDAPVECRTVSTCCLWDTELGRCLVYDQSCSLASSRVWPTLADPDGDPLRVTWLGGGLVAQTVERCVPADCYGNTLGIPSRDSCGRSIGQRVGDFYATDGLTTSGTATLTVNF